MLACRRLDRSLSGGNLSWRCCVLATIAAGAALTLRKTSLRAEMQPASMHSIPCLVQSFSDPKMRFMPLVMLLPPSLLGVFQCPSDGHHVDPESCATFYMCANGRVSCDSP